MGFALRGSFWAFIRWQSRVIDRLQVLLEDEQATMMHVHSDSDRHSKESKL